MADPVELNILGVQQLVGSKVNKTSDGAVGQNEGVMGETFDELALDLSDDELLHLAKKWTADYAGYEASLKKRQEANKTFYLGRQKEGSAYATTDGQPISSNLLFEAEETFLPAAMAKNPEPVVFSDNSQEGDKISSDIKTMLQYHADVLVLRRKVTLAVRHWSVYFLGIMKHGWDDKIQEITSEVRNPRNFILDRNGFVDEYADYEGYLGERITVTAQELVDLFPKHQSYITIMVDGKMGTSVTYTEWWTDEYCFYTFKDKVLDKNKNPHFNYAKKVKNELTGEESEEPGRNHFGIPKKPYTFLSVFSFQEQPHDVTTLIEQNIPNQRRISRRTEQIDFNLSRQNNSTAFSEDNFTQEEAKQASTAMAKGHPILVPPGRSIDEAIKKIDMSPVAAGFFTALEQDKADLRSIFGTEGISSTPPVPNDLATTRVLNHQQDNSRIGGGIGDAVEQFVKNIFNWWTQLYYVYYDEPHYAAIMGQMKAVEYIQLKTQDINRRIVVSVSPDSMKKHDEVTEMNQAMQLFQAGAIDPKTLLTRVNFPDPQNTAEQSVLWMLDKQTYLQLNFPEIAQKIMANQQAQMAQQQQLAQGQAQQQAQGVEQQQALQGMQGEQQLLQKEQAHQQTLRHKEEDHKTKVELAKAQAQLKTKTKEHGKKD